MNLKLWTHCRIATLQPDASQHFGLIDDAALVVEGELPADLRDQCTQNLKVNLDELHIAPRQLALVGQHAAHRDRDPARAP